MADSSGSTQNQQDMMNRIVYGMSGQNIPSLPFLGGASSQSDSSSYLSGGGSGQLDISGSPEQQAGVRQGLQFGQMLYGQGIADVGKQSKQYSDLVQGRLGADYAKSDVYRQAAAQRLAQGNVRAGLGGVDTTGATEQASRQAAMEAAGMNQDYRDKALALYGRNISAKQQGLAGQYMAGAGIGQAATPGAIPNYSSGISIICTELYNQGKITKHEYYRSACFGYKLKQETYFGYLTIATPVVKLMRKSDKFSNLFIGWAKSIAKHEPNLFTRLMMPICYMVGYARKIKKEKIARIA